jgi:hypothetical protein
VTYSGERYPEQAGATQHHQQRRVVAGRHPDFLFDSEEASG